MYIAARTIILITCNIVLRMVFNIVYKHLSDWVTYNILWIKRIIFIFVMYDIISKLLFFRDVMMFEFQMFKSHWIFPEFIINYLIMGIFTINYVRKVRRWRNRDVHYCQFKHKLCNIKKSLFLFLTVGKSVND